MAMTDRAIKSFKTSKKTILSDGNCLELEVTPSGIKRWYYRYKICNKSRKLPLGYYPEMGLMEARAEVALHTSKRRNSSELNPYDPLALRDQEIQDQIAAADAQEKQAELARIRYAEELADRKSVV